MRAFALASCCLVALTACGERQKAPASQVAASVNDREISVHQLNFALRQRPGVQPSDATAARKVLDELVDQELAVQAALDLKLDRDPNVLQVLEAARRELLARAYLERISQTTTKPSVGEIDRFYAEKPALFKARRIYSFQEFDIDIAPDKIAGLEAAIDNLTSAPAVTQYLKSSGLPHTTQSTTRLPETLPMDILDQVVALNEGKTLLVARPPQGVKAMVLTAATPAAVPEAQARTTIEQYLINSARRKAAEAQVAALRKRAVINYSGALAVADAPSAAPQ
ncbi:EpsD family peptidyl-prolyl cis-trans isomerase [Methylibium sp.]|uniref:EpsD family peptidyl-prolyl cis-trans isomerase n=1 Tax=Methylibium sp. TaxID=2067992 RepID=UPI003D12FBE9